MKKSLLLAALCAATPLALLLPGCSGGSIPGNPFTNPTPKPGATATPIPTAAGTQITNFVLGNGQRAILTTLKNGANLTGTLQIVPTPVAAGLKIAAIPLQFTFGSYKITGTVTPSGAFTIAGDFGIGGGPFSMTGQLQSATQDGSYTLKVGGNSETGVLPKSGTPFPNPTTKPPVNGNYKLNGNLTFSAVTAGSEVISTPITSFNDITGGGSLTSITTTASSFKGQALALNGQTGRVTGDGTSRLIQLVLASYNLEDVLAGRDRPFNIGREMVFSTQTANVSTLQYSQSSVAGTSIGFKVWRATGGTAIVKAIGTNSATVEFKNVRIEPSPIFGGTGSFTLNGTLSGTGLTVKTQ